MGPFSRNYREKSGFTPPSDQPGVLDSPGGTVSLTAWITQAGEFPQPAALAGQCCRLPDSRLCPGWSRCSLGFLRSGGRPGSGLFRDGLQGTHLAFNVSIWRYVMKRILGLCFAMFIALVAIALVGGDSGAVAGHGCHGRARCHGGLFAHKKKGCHGGLFGHKKNRCHGEAAAAAPACESGCGEAAPACESGCGESAAVEGDCSSCGGESAAVESGCSSCGGGEVVSGGCAGGNCEGSSVISEGVPTEAAPAAPAAVEAPAAPAKT